MDVRSYERRLENLPSDVRGSLKRKDEYMSRLFNNTVQSRTQCMKKQSDFYNKLSV